MKMHFLLNIGIFQPAMLVVRVVLFGREVYETLALHVGGRCDDGVKSELLGVLRPLMML